MKPERTLSGELKSEESSFKTLRSAAERQAHRLVPEKHWDSVEYEEVERGGKRVCRWKWKED